MPSRVIPKPKAMERNNRRALGGIGNLITRGVYAKPHQANRPVTRAFGKQLIANGKACGKIEGKIKKKKSPIADEAAVVVVPSKRKVINNKKVVAVKTGPETVLIEICQDAEEINKEKPATQESSGMDEKSTRVATNCEPHLLGLPNKKRFPMIDHDWSGLHSLKCQQQPISSVPPMHFYPTPYGPSNIPPLMPPGFPQQPEGETNTNVGEEGAALQRFLHRNDDGKEVVGWY